MNCKYVLCVFHFVMINDDVYFSCKDTAFSWIVHGLLDWKERIALSQNYYVHYLAIFVLWMPWIVVSFLEICL